MNEHDVLKANLRAGLLDTALRRADGHPLRRELYQAKRTDSSLISAPPILASSSPRRVALLGELGVLFQTVASGAPETIDPALTPEAQAVTLAERKARVVASQLQEGRVLGADTIVTLGGEILGKPVDDADATRMLRRLSGKEHRVVTGITILDGGNDTPYRSAVSSTVRFRALTDEEIERYVASSEPRGKAGAYAIQGLGAGLVSSLEGCYTNVVGLPLCETARLLRAVGVAVSPTWSGCRLPDGALCPRSV